MERIKRTNKAHGGKDKIKNKIWHRVNRRWQVTAHQCRRREEKTAETDGGIGDAKGRDK